MVCHPHDNVCGTVNFDEMQKPVYTVTAGMCIGTLALLPLNQIHTLGVLQRKIHAGVFKASHVDYISLKRLHHNCMI